MKAELFDLYADRPLPRYTSYPTAPHFAALDEATGRSWLGRAGEGGPASLYLHVPFCRSMCWYCGCHTSVTHRDGPIHRYLDTLEREIDLVTAAIGSKLEVRHVHFGGGTPTLIPPDRFVELMAQLRRRFEIHEEAEIAIEVDPRTLEPEMIQALAAGGVNRASLGVQSFDPKVQRAINRVQTLDQTRTATEGLRAAGISGINFDLIYGLPHQDVASCLETVEQALSLAPDRFAVFGYAHVPQFKLHQRKIDAGALGDGRARHAQAEAIAGALVRAGHVRIGLDHFARPEDGLARAFAAGTLHRNFQGYTTDDCQTLIGLGASSIGRLPDGYVQNSVLVAEYQRRVGEDRLPMAKGKGFAPDDRVRAAVIERIMCDHEVDLEAVCASFGEDPQRLAGDNPALDELLGDGLARREKHRIILAEEARPLVRVLAAAFDAYLGQGTARHSRAV